MLPNKQLFVNKIQKNHLTQKREKKTWKKCFKNAARDQNIFLA